MQVKAQAPYGKGRNFSMAQEKVNKEGEVNEEEEKNRKSEKETKKPVAMLVPFQPGTMTLAICYFGMTRSTRHVYQSHFDCLFNVLRQSGIKYDVYMHTWKTSEGNNAQGFPQSIPINYEEYKLLEPDHYQIDDQDVFKTTINQDDYFYPDDPANEGSGAWRLPLTTVNHICALESLKRVLFMAEGSEKDYSAIMVVRPDVLFHQKFQVSWLRDLVAAGENELYLPDFDHFGGYNDRWCLGTPCMVHLYATRGIELLPYRKTVGKIYSEILLKWFLEKYQIKVKLINFHFTIIRPGGSTLY